MKRRRSILAVVLVALFPLAAPLGAQPAPEAYSARPLTPDDVRADVSLLRQALEEVHAGYDRYVPRRVMDTAFARLERRAAEPMTDLELYREVALVLSTIRCNHTKAEYPASLESFRRTAPTHLPATMRIIGSRMFVDRSAERSLAHGTEILRINGRPVADVIRALGRYVAIDGFTDFARSALLERDSDLLGSDLDHYWPVEYGFVRRWTFQLRDAAGVTRTAELAPITIAAWRGLSGTSALVDFRTGTSTRMLDDSTAILRVASFVNYRTPINPDSLYRALFTRFDAGRITHLIVDLRENGGGSDDASQALLRYLVASDVQPVTRIRRRSIQIDSSLASAFDTWSDRAWIFSPSADRFMPRADGWFVERRVPPVLRAAPEAFTGRVSVLVGRRNSSGTTMLLAVLQQIGARTGRLRLVGEETGGSAEGPTAGQILFLRLPNSGMRVRIPLQRSDVNVADAVAGFGVFPDVDATETLADFRAGIDRALTIARRTPWRSVTSPLAPSTGVMRGVLEYRDYTSERRVTLPTVVHLSPIGASGAFRQRTIYDDGPGKTLYSSESIRVRGSRWIEGSGDPAGIETSGTTLQIVSRRRTAEGEVFVLRGRGVDDGAPVEFRYTVTLGASVVRRLKEFRRRGGAWEYRHEYRLARSADAR